MDDTPELSAADVERRDQTLTAQLIDLTSWAHPLAESIDVAERAFVDTLGCLIAATTDPAVLRAHSAFTPHEPTTFPYGRAADPVRTAMLGGLAAHALDYDDVDSETISHPSAVLLPALIALGEELDCTGGAIIEAFWAGIAANRMIAARIGIFQHYRAGWHATATVGALAATVAVSRLLRLDREAVGHALGIAGSLAAGSRQNFGTMTKPLHAGTAAANAVIAGKLGSTGFTAAADMVDAPMGFLALHHQDDAESRTASDAGIELLGLNIKLHPCCYYIQSAADAMLEMVEDGLVAARIAAIDVCVQPEGLAPLIHHRPSTGLQGKFSMEYALGACAVDGRLSLTSFTDRAVQRASVQRIIPLVTSTTNEVPPFGPAEWKSGYATVTVTTVDGQTVRRRVDLPQGHAGNPLTEANLRAKFDDCVTYVGHSIEESLYAQLRGLRDVRSVRTLLLEIRESLAGESSMTA